jgi:hypothetical protein
MKSNIGDKLQAMASMLGVLEVLTAIIVGINFISQGSGYHGDESLVATGWIILIGGSCMSIASSMILYGFGVLIEKTQKIHELLAQIQKTPEQTKPTEQEALPIVQETHPAEQKTRRTWVCPSCGYRNDISSLYCLNCKKR